MCCCFRVWQGQVNERLRALLGTLGVPRATEYRCHDLRRGHYEDLRAQGKGLSEILLAAGVRSPKAPKPYLHPAQLELAAVMEAHLAPDSDEEP